MTIIAAFYWDGSAKKRKGGKVKIIAHMIVDDESNYSLLSAPKNHEIKFSDFESFKKESKSEIEIFFQQILKLGNKPIKVEYQIVNDSSTHFRHHIKGELSQETKYINSIFNEKFEEAKQKNGLLIRADNQHQCNLRKKSLKDFKNKLLECGYISSLRKDSYRWHLWALALHATNGKYIPQLNKLRKAILKQDVKQDMPKLDKLNLKRA